MEIIEGKVFKIGDNINADYIIPARYLDLYEPEDLGRHALAGLGEEYPKMLKDYRVIVSGENLGLGSAREQAPNALKGVGIRAIVAKSFARIFYRNTLNVGLAAIECSEAAEALKHGEDVSIDLEKGIIRSRGRAYHFTSFSDQIMRLLNAGGMIPFLKRELKIND